MVVEKTITVTGIPQTPERRGNELLDAAVRYAEERHWDVHPGAWLEEAGRARRCSCPAAGDCPAPGGHPMTQDWATRATSNAAEVRRLWARQPRASILLPTGRTFDALDVPEAAGCLALARLERMRLPLGPVACTPDRRMLFFVLPGAVAKVPELVRCQGRRPGSLDLMAWGEGDYVVAPPTRSGSYGWAQWVRRPTAANRWLPDAEELAGQIAYACAR